MDRFGVLVFHDQHLDDEQQIAFSRQLGKLEEATGDIMSEKERRLSMELIDVGYLVWVICCGTLTVLLRMCQPSIHCYLPARSQVLAATQNLRTCVLHTMH